MQKLAARKQASIVVMRTFELGWDEKEEQEEI